MSAQKYRAPFFPFGDRIRLDAELPGEALLCPSKRSPLGANLVGNSDASRYWIVTQELYDASQNRNAVWLEVASFPVEHREFGDLEECCSGLLC